MFTLPLAPLPFPQLSLKFTKGEDEYPDPGLIISTPSISPAAPIIAFPVAPDPPPP